MGTRLGARDAKSTESILQGLTVQGQIITDGARAEVVGETGVWCAQGQQIQEGFTEEAATEETQIMNRNLYGRALGWPSG